MVTQRIRPAAKFRRGRNQSSSELRKAYHDGQWGGKHGYQRRHAHAADEQLPGRLVQEGHARMRNEREHEDLKHQDPHDL